ncbi:DUF3857 domain-containing protein [Cryomorphaceae bacterium 1068]|nr:DUF3857 domain-containing protein [Cryomorphaceae bacterium 1068]
MRFTILLAALMTGLNTQAISINAIIEKSNTTLEVRSEKKIRESVHRRIRIISEKGNEHAQLAFYEDDFREMRLYDVNVFNSTGQLVRTFHKKDFSEQMGLEQLSSYDELRIFYLDASLSRYPYTIEYTYTFERDYIFDYSWSAAMSDYTITVDRDLTFSLPEEMEVSMFFDSTEVIHSQVLDDGIVIHSFRADSARSLVYEPYSPLNEKGRVQLIFNTFNFNGYKGSFESWSTFGLWMNDLWADRNQLSRSAFDAVYPSGYEHLSPKERARVAYRYIQKNMRYVAITYGMGGFQTMEANDTFKKGYGDCKALTNFMHSVLAYADVESFPALAYAGSNPVKIYPDRPTNSFNHVILCIPLDGDTLWTECTSNRSPFNYLSDFTDDRYVMLMTPTGGKLVRTPNYSEMDNSQERNVLIDISANGSAMVNFEGTYRNLAIDRSPFYRKEMAGFKNERAMELASIMKSFDVEEIEVDLFPQDQPIMNVNAQVKDRLFAKRMGSKMLVKPFLFKDRFPVFEDDARENDIYFRRGYSSIDTIQVLFPEHLHLNGPIENQSIHTEFGELELTAVESDQKDGVMLIRRFSFPSGLYAKDEYAKVKEFFEAMERTNTISLVLVP